MEVNFSNQARSFLRNLEKLDYKRIRRRIERLKMNPFPREAKKLKGKGFFRIRAGPFRIIYELEDNVLYISSINKRERAYK